VIFLSLSNKMKKRLLGVGWIFLVPLFYVFMLISINEYI
jgi:hypothetical protein